MKIDELIEGYEKAVAEHKVAVQLEEEKTLNEAKKIFEEMVHKELGDLWNELLPKGTECLVAKNESTIDFNMKVAYEKKTGVIHQSFHLHRKTWGNLFLDFGHWGGEHMSVDFPASAEELGRMFSNVKRSIFEKEESDRRRDERDIEILMNFSNLNEAGVAERLESASLLFPKHKQEFHDKAMAQLEVLGKEAENRLLAQVEYELRKSEEEQLGLLADYAWKGPFVIYQIDYGARLDGAYEDGGEVYTNHFYTLTPTPNADGYFRAFGNGEYKRLIKPENIISTEVLTIEKAGQSPTEIRRYVDLHSKNVSDVSILCCLPPIDLFAFDYDALRVAVEAEQDSEVADAAQEDLS